MNRRGFTLMELLAAMVIIGIVGGTSIPLIKNAMETNTSRKYKLDSESVLYSGKLYTDSYGDDLFCNREFGCKKVAYSELANKRLLDDIDDNDISCATNETYVLINKNEKGKYTYKAYIGCGEHKADGSATEATFFISEMSKRTGSCVVETLPVSTPTPTPTPTPTAPPSGFNNSTCTITYHPNYGTFTANKNKTT